VIRNHASSNGAFRRHLRRCRVIEYFNAAAEACCHETMLLTREVRSRTGNQEGLVAC
jgi:hypothetical protein